MSSWIYIPLLLFLAYLFYTRIYKVYKTIWYYQRQGVVFHKGILPFIGSYKDLAKYAGASKNTPLVQFVLDEFCKGDPNNIPPIVGIGLSELLSMFINRPELAEELLLNKNKYFDKH